MKNPVKDALFGVAVGDALGVPVEFKSREYLKQNPVTDMMGYGTHHQPEGTWSDDSSLTFCLAESLCKGYNLKDLANRFINWYEHDYWTPHGKVFDVGIATSQAIYSLGKSTEPTMAGPKDEYSNGNGSLMRILPLAFYIKNLPIERRFEIVKNVSSLTHGHIRSVICCFIYLELALQILEGKEKTEAYQKAVELSGNFLYNQPICSEAELDKFHRIFGKHRNPNYDIISLPECYEAEIHSSGYVLDSLEASIWCLLKSNSYEETVLMAVNLGSDTDTTGAIAGGLAGLLYGFENIPSKWIEKIARKKDIEDLSERQHEQVSLKY